MDAACALKPALCVPCLEHLGKSLFSVQHGLAPSSCKVFSAGLMVTTEQKPAVDTANNQGGPWGTCLITKVNSERR